MAKLIIGVEDEPRMQFTLDGDPANPPQIIALPHGKLLMLVGRYASKGDSYHYRHVTNPVIYYGEIKEWIKYRVLTG